MHNLFTNKRWVLLLSVLIFSNILITGLSLMFVFKNSIEQVEETLLNTVERQKVLIQTLNEQGKNLNEIIEFYKLMETKQYHLGKSGEFTIARKEGNNILFLLSNSPDAVYKKALPNRGGIPSDLAFQNKNGFTKTYDYKNELVYAAYTYVPSLQLAVVAKVPVKEVNNPFYNALLLSTLVFIVFISVSLYLFTRISNPIIKATFDNELKFRKAVQLAPFPIMIHTDDGEVLDISQGWTEITGYQLADIPTITRWGDLAHGTQKTIVLKNIKDLFNQESPKKEGEYTILCKNGESRTWQFASTSLGKLNDGRSAVISIANDVTERKMEEERIRLSEEKFSFFFNEMSSGCSIQELVFDNTGTAVDYITVDCNKAFERILNVNKNDVVGKAASKFMSNQELKNWLNIFGDVAITGFSKSYEQYSPVNDKYFKGVVFSPKQNYFAVTFEDITQQRKAENSLIKNEQSLKLAISSGHFGIWDWNVKDNSMVWDDRMFELYGISRESFTNNLNAWTNSLHPEDKEQAISSCEAALKGEKEYNTIFRVIHPDGKVVYIKANGLVIRDQKGDAIRMIGINQDITESKIAEEELIQKDALTRTTMDNLPIIFYLIDNNGIFRLSIGAGLSSLGLKPNQVVGLSVFEIYKDFPEITNSINKALSGETANFESHVNGAYHYNIVNPYTDANKNRGIVGVALDITERKQIELEIIAAKEKAEENEKKLKESQTIARLGSWEFDIEKGLFTFTDNFFNIFKTSAEEMGGYQMSLTDYAKFIHPEDAFMLEEETRKAIETTDLNFSRYLEHRIIYKDRGIGYIGVRYFIRKNKYGKTIKTYGVNQDITEKKHIEQELLKAKEKAEESDRLKTAFLQNMSHEIRTPMNAIMGFAELLPRNYNNKEKLSSFSTIISQRCTDLLGVINDILDISKIESGQLSVNLEKCTLSKLFEELQAFFKEQQIRIKKQHVDFFFSTNCNLSGLIIITDKIKLKQIFINLISNAFKFTENGKIEAGCILNESNKLKFYVSDTGIGIPLDKQQFVFERFFQVHNGGNKPNSGNGLGLSIVKGLVDLLGGEIWLESEPGRGSTFFFTIDFKKVSNATPPIEVMANSQQIIKKFEKPVLIVEDDPFNIDLIKEILIDLNLNLYYVNTGKEAIETARSRGFGLILMDIGLPDMKGFDVIKEILHSDPSAKIIAQTAYASAEDEKKAKDFGCIDYLSKPLNANHLLTMIGKYLT